MDIQYGESAVLTPCDFPFARDGVVVSQPAGVPGVIFADLDLDALDEFRKNGTVLNLKDRRDDLYGLDWK
jgi:predicted amidohydrolase